MYILPCFPVLFMVSSFLDLNILGRFSAILASFFKNKDTSPKNISVTQQRSLVNLGYLWSY